MKPREQIDWFGQPVIQSCVQMAEGNPGAATLIGRLAVSEKGLIALMKCDDSNIRGHQLWVAYKDLCKEDFDWFFDEIAHNCRDLAAKVQATERGEFVNEEWFSP